MHTPPCPPPAFVRRIRAQLGDEAEALLRSLAAPRAFGLRLNPLKLGPDDPAFPALAARFKLRPVPWCADGFYYDEETRPGKHPYHAAGLYYIQEPSAMIAAELLDPKPGELVLDLAAAPGGKTTHLAGKMAGQGTLVANEIHPARARILSGNVERMGFANVVVTCARPGDLADRFPEAFDRILLDAPCSGEGMFRKDPQAAAEWSPAQVEACAVRQRGILEDAARLLKPGGRLVYSTCTFNREENEETVAAFAERHPDFTLVREERLWPHLAEGEGHYAALLEKRGPAEAGRTEPRGRAESAGRQPGRSPRRARAAFEGAGEAAAMRAFRAFAERDLPGWSLPDEGFPLLFGESLYWIPRHPALPFDAQTLSGLKTPRPGLQLGMWRKGRFEPAHALAMAVPAAAARLRCVYAPEARETAAYMRGESLAAPNGAAEGWGLMTVDGWPVGWFKAGGGQLKNHLPKGLRAPV